MNGQVLSKWRVRGSEFMFALMLFGVFMPMQVLLLPMSQALGWLGIASSIWDGQVEAMTPGWPAACR